MGSNLGTRPLPQWTRHLEGMALEELFAAAEAVQAVQAHAGWVHISRLMDAEIATVDAGMDGRLLGSKSEYAFAHGRRGGLRGATEAADAIVLVAERKLAEQRAKHESGAESPQEAYA